jgi:hypothetical protein
VRVFLDANVLFSMALGGPVFNAILEVAKRGRLHLLTSAFCYLEAWRNIELWTYAASTCTGNRGLKSRLSLPAMSLRRHW